MPSSRGGALPPPPSEPRPGLETSEAAGRRVDPAAASTGAGVASVRTLPRIVLDTEAALLQYHPKAKIVHHEFRRFIYGDELRAVLSKGLELFEKHGACKWLSDDRHNGPLRPSDEQWALNHWFPRVKAAGWKYWAVVMPEKVLGQMNMKRWMAAYEPHGIEARPFGDPEVALAWLESLLGRRRLVARGGRGRAPAGVGCLLRAAAGFAPLPCLEARPEARFRPDPRGNSACAPYDVAPKRDV
jgi:hypothetical protein